MAMTNAQKQAAYKAREKAKKLAMEQKLEGTDYMVPVGVVAAGDQSTYNAIREASMLDSVPSPEYVQSKLPGISGDMVLALLKKWFPESDRRSTWLGWKEDCHAANAIRSEEAGMSGLGRASGSTALKLTGKDKTATISATELAHIEKLRKFQALSKENQIKYCRERGMNPDRVSPIPELLARNPGLTVEPLARPEPESKGIIRGIYDRIVGKPEAAKPEPQPELANASGGNCERNLGASEAGEPKEGDTWDTLLTRRAKSVNTELCPTQKLESKTEPASIAPVIHNHGLRPDDPALTGPATYTGTSLFPVLGPTRSRSRQ